MLARGARLGTYEVLAALGEGGMGQVFRARDSRLGREVALKVLAEPYKLDAERRARLDREARVLASLNHPNIATLLGLEEVGDMQALVLELVDGVTLAERLSEGPLPVAEAVAIAQQISAALDTAHEHGVVHRDLKPDNIKIRADGTVKLLDFGLAKAFATEAEASERDSPTVTALDIGGRAVMGTPAYMSPEQARGLPVDKRADIWAFGCVLYEMLAGRRAFAGERPSDVVAQIIEREPDFGALPPDTPSAIGRLVRRCLAKDPRQRLRDIGDARFELAHGQDLGADAPAGAARGRAAGRRVALSAVSLAVIAIVAALLWITGRPGSGKVRSGEATGQPSIAVLPFVNMSADPDQEYFSDGLSEELINQLAHVDGLRVTARTSAFAFKGRSQDLRVVGETLGVTHILEGSVRKSDDRVRVTAQLVNVADGYDVWSEKYESKLDDVFAIQDEIAAAVAAKLGPALGVAPRSIDYGGTSLFEAYDHLLRGSVQLAKASPEGLRAAIEEYRRALAIDPGYARASAQLAIAASQLLISAPPDRVVLEREREEATRQAIEGAPRLPVTLSAKMWWHSDRHEWLQGDEACAAVFATGGDPASELRCGGFLTLIGRVRAGLPYREAGRRADPLSMNVAQTVARQYALLDMGEELAREYERTRNLPGDRWNIDEAMLVYLMHHGAPADELADRLEPICAEQSALPPGVCSAYVQAARSPGQARAILSEQLDRLREVAPGAASGVAYWAAYLGESDLALDALEVFGRGAGSASLQSLWFPLLREARRDPRFKAIVRDLGFVDFWRKTGRWSDFCRAVGDDDFECF